MAKKDAIEKVKDEETALATVPEDFAASAGLGTESLGSDDVRPPRLLVAQSGSPQVKKGDPKRIEGLEEAQLFNDLSGEIYGEGPLKIVVVKSLGARGVEFAPREEGGGVVDFNVPLNDPRMQFRDGPPDPKTGRPTRIKPVATKFYDYLLWLPEQQEIVAWSLKSTQLKLAIQLNSQIKSPLKLGGQIVMSPPAWARTFELGTAMEKNDQGTWAGYTIKAAGVTETETRLLCLGLFRQYQSKNVVIERDAQGPGEAAEESTDSGM